MTQQLHDEFKRLNCTTSYIPGGCTGFVQVLDVSLNKPLKAQAWKELHEKYKSTIVETFQRVGLSLNPDGSEDHKIKIKDLDDIKVGDFTRKTLDPENGF